MIFTYKQMMTTITETMRLSTTTIQQQGNSYSAPSAQFEYSLMLYWVSGSLLEALLREEHA
jgi:hypothetical protein